MAPTVMGGAGARNCRTSIYRPQLLGVLVRTMMSTGDDVTTFVPGTSVAVAVMEYSPTGTPVQWKQKNGALVAMPMLLVPAKYCTLVTGSGKCLSTAQIQTFADASKR